MAANPNPASNILACLMRDPIAGNSSVQMVYNRSRALFQVQTSRKQCCPMFTQTAETIIRLLDNRRFQHAQARPTPLGIDDDLIDTSALNDFGIACHHRNAGFRLTNSNRLDDSLRIPLSKTFFQDKRKRDPDRSRTHHCQIVHRTAKRNLPDVPARKEDRCHDIGISREDQMFSRGKRRTVIRRMFPSRQLVRTANASFRSEPASPTTASFAQFDRMHITINRLRTPSVRHDSSFSLHTSARLSILIGDRARSFGITHHAGTFDSPAYTRYRRADIVSAPRAHARFPRTGIQGCSTLTISLKRSA